MPMYPPKMHCANVHVRCGMRRHHLVRRELRQPKGMMMTEVARRERGKKEKERRKNEPVLDNIHTIILCMYLCCV